MIYANKILLKLIIAFFISGIPNIDNHIVYTEVDSVFGVGRVDNDPLIVKECNEFAITGNGSNAEWEKSSWHILTKLDSGGGEYLSKFKILYSNSGIYILFRGEDEKITTKEFKDMEAIWHGDVFEVFFHPNPEVRKYYEYQVNPFEKQIVLTITNSQEDGFLSWVPFGRDNGKNYNIDNKVEILGGKRELNAKIHSWSAEIFLSYKSMALLPNVPPKSGMVWNANFCRLDYDGENRIKWSWSPTIKNSFHELENFRSIKFE